MGKRNTKPKRFTLKRRPEHMDVRIITIEGERIATAFDGNCGEWRVMKPERTTLMVEQLMKCTNVEPIEMPWAAPTD